jgi:hypothetical protein
MQQHLLLSRNESPFYELAFLDVANISGVCLEVAMRTLQPLGLNDHLPGRMMPFDREERSFYSGLIVKKQLYCHVLIV